MENLYKMSLLLPLFIERIVSDDQWLGCKLPVQRISLIMCLRIGKKQENIAIHHLRKIKPMSLKPMLHY